MKRIIALFCILMLISISGCVEQETEQPEETGIEETGIEQIEISTDELLSEVRCVIESSISNKTTAEASGRIVGVITNTKNTEIKVEKDIQLFINGQINREFNCDKQTLEPGEQTFCETLNGRFKIRTGKNRLSSILDGSSYNEVITC